MGTTTAEGRCGGRAVPAMRAVIVEDDLLTGLELQACLAYFGFDTCAVAHTQQEAVDLSLRYRPDLLAVDIALPQGNGIDAVRAIWGRTRIPAIFVTGFPGDVDARFPGAVVVDKPFTEGGLRKALMRAMPEAPEGWRRAWTSRLR